MYIFYKLDALRNFIFILQNIRIIVSHKSNELITKTTYQRIAE